LTIGITCFTGVILICAYLYQYSVHQVYWMLIGGWLLVFICGIFFYQPKLRRKCCVFVIMGFGFLLKYVYVCYTSIYTRQHDVRDFTDEYKGHAGYIQYFIDNHHLPDFDPTTHYQFYHPPLHHIISAIWIEASERIFDLEPEVAQESLQSLTLFYAIVIVILSYRILQHFNLRGCALYIPLIIIAFHPAFILFSGSINNDVLSVVFILGAILCTLQWYRNQTLKNILKIAFCVGLGMMTKLSAGIVAIPIAIVFLVVLIKKCQKRQWYI